MLGPQVVGLFMECELVGGGMSLPNVCLLLCLSPLHFLCLSVVLVDNIPPTAMLPLMMIMDSPSETAGPNKLLSCLSRDISSKQ